MSKRVWATGTPASQPSVGSGKGRQSFHQPVGVHRPASGLCVTTTMHNVNVSGAVAGSAHGSLLSRK